MAFIGWGCPLTPGIQHAHLVLDALCNKQHFLLLDILNVREEKIICPLLSPPSKESEAQRGCVWIAREATERGGRIFGERRDIWRDKVASVEKGTLGKEQRHLKRESFL